MNMFKKSLAACAVAALVATSSFAAEEVETVKSYGYTPIAIGLATPVTLPWGFDWDVFGLDANLAYSDCNKMYGIEFALGANTARLKMIGIQASTVFNMAARDAYGIQFAFLNFCNREYYGIEAGAFMMNRSVYGLTANIVGSITDNEFEGMNVGIVGSAVRNDMWGLQLAGICNFAREMHGLQLAVGYNQTSVLHGAQIGLVNVALECPNGFQIGLVNIIMDNTLPFLPIVNGYF